MSATRFLFLFSLNLLIAFPTYAATSVQNLRQWRAPDHTRLVFDLSGPLEHRLFTLADPHRVVIDMEDAQLSSPLPELDYSGPVLAQVRTGRADDGRLRVVLDLKTEVRARTSVLKPAGPYGHRLVIDLYDPHAAEQEKAEDSKSEGGSVPPVATKSSAANGSRRPARAPSPRAIVVAIDAGHGGEDPGAVGRRYRTYEKDVTLAVARELSKLVAQAPNMRALLTRDGDYYIGLRERFRKAREQRADIFVSIHADAVPGRQAFGSSVYVLSEKGATDAMAKFLADKENSADLIGGVSLNDKDNLLAKVLLDLSHTKTIQDSLNLGEDLLAELKGVGPVHFDRVRQAGFTVLKAPDIPSVLVETAFISNPSEEKKLRTVAFQKHLAEGIFKGVKRFVARNRGTLPASASAAAREHIVRSGETLTSIARLYNMQVETLRTHNRLTQSQLPVGYRLRLPEAKGS